MRDKKKTSLSINDIVQENKSNTSKDAPNFEHISFTFDEEFDNKLTEYNKNITNFHEAYKTTQPLHKVLCRVYAAPLSKTPGGMIIPNQAPIQVQTKSGVGTQWIDDPFSFTTKAVVVASPTHNSLEQGDLVVLTMDALQKQVMGQGQEAEPFIANSFIHPDVSTDVTTPSDPSNDNYGYFLIDPFKIITKI